MAAKDVAVGGARLLDGVLQGAGNVLLSDDLGESLRTVFAGQDGVTHGRKSRLYAKNLDHRGHREHLGSSGLRSGVASDRLGATEFVCGSGWGADSPSGR